MLKSRSFKLIHSSPFEEMEKKDKISGSSSKQKQKSKLNIEQAWLQLTKQYLDDLPKQLEGIREILKTKDYATIKEQAHRIKGTSATYRLNSISQTIAQLEDLAEKRNSEAIVTAINKIKRLIDVENDRLKTITAGNVDNTGDNANG